MNILNTLYFPDTAVTSQRQSPLFLLFSTIHYVAPVEGDVGQAATEIGTYSSFCQAHTPHPLGKDRERFLYLLKDIQNRKDDYATQLGSLTLASLSQLPPQEDDSRTTIQSSLLTGDREVGTKAIEEPDPFWHSRLVLKIAEILDREQEEVAQSLLMLEESEEDLFDRLKGEGEDDDVDNLLRDLEKIKASLGTPTTETVEKRLRAWFRFIDGAELPPCQIWTTTTQEVADILTENHFARQRKLPVTLCRIAVPLHLGGSSEQALQHLLEFKSESEQLTRSLFEALTSSPEKKTAPPAIGELTQKLGGIIDEYYPESGFGRTTLEILGFDAQLSSYSGVKLQDVSAPALLALIGV